MRSKHHGSFRELIAEDLNTMPLMNLFVALIPMLLISAVFLNVTVIDMDGPPADASETAADEREPLGLEVFITDAEFVVAGHGIESLVVARNLEDADAQLTAGLSGIARRYPENQDVAIVSQPETRYDDIIAVMDIARDAGLPAVSLRGER